MISQWFERAPLVIGHRGAARSAPENTLAGFRRALAVGADAVELDAKLTADGVAVCHHDRTLERTTNGKGRVLDWTWEALRHLDAGSHFGTAFAGEPIPRLEDVFAELGPSLLINVELTNYGSPGDALPEVVHGLIRRHGMAERVLLSSFNTRALRRSARLSPRVPLGLLLRKDQGRIRRALYPWIAPHEVTHLGDSLVTSYVADREQRRGKRLVVWTVNDVARALELLALGAHGLITDEPESLRPIVPAGAAGRSR
ncbi:MAG: glycerophosphodiester phosphodiesterase family protein [Anaerolineales bacterium]